MNSLKHMFTLQNAKYDYDDPSAVIIAESFVEESLGRALTTKFPYYSKQIEKNVFERGALSTFSNRIWIARAFGLFGPKTLANLHCIREIRNNFAHWKEGTDFNTAEIKGKCDQITLVTRATEIIHAGMFITEEEWPPCTPRDRYVLSCILYWNAFMHIAAYEESERWIEILN